MRRNERFSLTFYVKKAEANIGTPSIFTIVSVAKEYLYDVAMHREEAEKRKEEEKAIAEEEVIHSLSSCIVVVW